MTAPDHTRARRRIDIWRRDPVPFARDVLGVEPWTDEPGYDSQATLLRSLAFDLSSSTRSGHKTGKALRNETPVPTPSGWRQHGDLRVGDQVFDERGRPCRVTAVMRWRQRPLMRVTFEDGTYIDADERHEWVVHTRESRKRTHKPPVTVETWQMAAAVDVPNGRGEDGAPRRIPNFTVDVPGALDAPEAELELDPYVLGLWLGDGETAGGTFTGIDGLESAIASAGFDVRAVTGKSGKFYVRKMVTVLRSVGVFDNKHIPERYLWASAAQRLALLQGLMDTDGTCDKRGRCSFTNTNRRLADGVLHLARSLGIKARMREDRATLYGRDCGPCWEVSWHASAPVFRLERKLARLRSVRIRKAMAHRRMAVVSVVPLLGLHDVQCIEVDSPSHLYLAGPSMVPTHNSLDFGIIALWNYALFPGVRVILTAPTWRQVEEVVWREIGILYRRARKRGFDLGGKLAERPDRGLRGPQDREVWGFSTDDPDRFSGISGPRVVYLLDEGAGIDDAIDEAIEGNRAGGAQKHTAGNPTRTEGWFFRSHHEESEAYVTHHLNSERTPNARGAGKPIPGVATAEWVARKRKQWHPHETHPIYGYRVRGDFPAQASHSVFGLAVVTLALRRWTVICPPSEELKRLEVGLDCARYGDDANVVQGLRGTYAYVPHVMSGQDSIQVAGWARSKILAMRTHAEKSGRGPKPRVKVDVVGVGAGVYDQLRATAPELDVHPVNGGSSPTTEPTDGDPGHANLRAEMHFAAADWIEAGGQLPPDQELRSELLAVRYRFTKLGALQVEEKDELKKRIARSPDRMDALTLAVHVPKAWSPKPLKIGALTG